MSVPPEIDDRQQVVLHALRRRSRSSPAPAGCRSRTSCAARRARSPCAAPAPIFSSASMYLADVPKCGHAARRRRSRTAPCRASDERRAVVEQQRRAGGEPGHQPVPHHPAAGGEVEQAVAGLQVAVQQVLLQVLQQRAAGAVHDALRHAGRAGGVEDVERMVERQARRTRAAAARSGAMNASSATAPRDGREVAARRGSQVGHDHDALDATAARATISATLVERSAAACRCSQ